MSKELYIAGLEHIMADLIAAGVAPDRAYDIAGDQAYDAMCKRLADMADNERKRFKEGESK